MASRAGDLGGGAFDFLTWDVYIGSPAEVVPLRILTSALFPALPGIGYADREGKRLLMAMSAGVAEWRPEDAVADKTLKRADELLHRAKCEGSNRVASIDC